MSDRDTIRSLGVREQCRDKVAIWFGSKDNFLHPLREVLANAIDEITNNFDSGSIGITLSSDLKTITVNDTGRGIPLRGKTNGVENYKLLLTQLFAGTNYDNNKNGKITTGTNGVGITIINYCSKYFKIQSYTKDYYNLIEFEDGGTLVKNEECKNNNAQTGTIIEFELDDEVFTNTTYNYEEVKEIIKNVSGVSNDIEFSLYCGEKHDCFNYRNIKEYITDIESSNTSEIYLGTKRTFEDGETNIIECCLCSSSSPTQKTYLNYTYLSEQGTIYRGVLYGVRDYINKHVKENRLSDGKNDITHSDIEDSISFICNVLSTNTEYSNQTKLSTNKSLYMKLAKEYIQDVLELYKTEQPKQFEKFVNHILEVQRYNNRSLAAKKALKKKLSEKVDNIANRVEGLIDCKEHGVNSELFIAEGKSALGSIIAARNPKNQAGIAIRGKLLNCLKTDYATIFDNKEVVDIIKSLGCGIETDKKNKDLGCFDINALRYGKIIIATDADADGFQISCLLLTMFYRLTPTLIKNGHLYICLTPLYEIKNEKTKEVHYAFTDSEKDEIISKMYKYTVNRNKGLGEIDAKVLSETGVNPETRNILKVTFDNATKMVSAFDDWMGLQGENRKQFIENDLNKYCLE